MTTEATGVARRNRSPLAGAIAGALLALGTVVPTSAAAATVDVRDNAFDPREVQISVGDSVTWRVQDSNHTVRSDDEVDGRPLFEFPAGTGLLTQGEEHSYVFAEPGTYSYHCEVHPLMRGAVYVDVQPPGPEVRTVPSVEHPTITAALTDAPPGTTVELLPGTYRERVVVSSDEITLRGLGSSPSDVVIDGGSLDKVGIGVTGDGVRLENLSVRRFIQRGVVLQGAHRFRLHRVQVVENALDGIRVVGSRGGGLTETTTSGSAGVGLAIVGCQPCGTLVDRVTASHNGQGILVENAGHVEISRSLVAWNGEGITLRARPSADQVQAPRGLPTASSASVRGNLVEDNAVGITVDGAWNVTVEDNRVTRYRDVGLRWRVPAGGVCFSGNTDPAAPDGQPASEPPALQQVTRCGGPAVPSPGADQTVQRISSPEGGE